MSKQTLTKNRASQWQGDIKIVRRTKDSAWAHIEAIVRIRDSESYLEAYETFDDFLAMECVFHKTYAYQLMKNAETRVNVSAIADTAPGKMAHLSAIGKAPPDKQAEVFATVQEKAELEGREATANDYAKEAKKHIPAPATEEITDDETAEDTGMESGAGWEGADVDELRRELNAVIKRIKDADGPGFEGIRASKNGIVLDLDNAKARILSAIPHKTCPYCIGNDTECDPCKGHGWVSKSTFELAPKELKDAIKKLSNGGRG